VSQTGRLQFGRRSLGRFMAANRAARTPPAVMAEMQSALAARGAKQRKIRKPIPEPLWPLHFISVRSSSPMPPLVFTSPSEIALPPPSPSTSPPCPVLSVFKTLRRVFP
jgi:hypothetical protein